jgi:hypothetical protein
VTSGADLRTDRSGVSHRNERSSAQSLWFIRAQNDQICTLHTVLPRCGGTYWNRVTEQWGARRLGEPTPSDIRQLMTLVKVSAVQRRNGRGGRSSQEHADPAAAHRDRLPPRRRARPAPGRPGPRAVPGPAPGKGRDHPLAAGLPHPDGRAGPPYRGPARAAGRGLLRYADGRPVTYRRYDGLWVRIGRHLPWARTQQISTHWIRHTTLTRVERPRRDCSIFSMSWAGREKDLYRFGYQPDGTLSPVELGRPGLSKNANAVL